MSSLLERLSKRRFWSRYGEKAEGRGIPFEAVLELTYGCNLRCVHCFNPTHEARHELRTEQLHRIIDELADLGVFNLTFTGGEVLTRPDCFEIFGYAKAKGFSLILLTNATLITQERANRIQALGFTSIEVSIYGATAETYEGVTGVPGSFKKFLEGLELLRARRLPLLIKMPVMTLNQHEVQQARDLAHGWGIRFVYSTEIHPRTDRRADPLRYRLRPDEVVEVNRKMVGYQLWKAEGGGEQAAGCGAQRDLFTCKCGKSNLAVTPHGAMNLCVALPIPRYDLTAGTVAAGWQALKDVVASARPGPAYGCHDCSVEPHCRQGPMNAWLETGDLSPCLPYFKDLATLERQVREGVSAEERPDSPRPPAPAGHAQAASPPLVTIDKRA